MKIAFFCHQRSSRMRRKSINKMLAYVRLLAREMLSHNEIYHFVKQILFCLGKREKRSRRRKQVCIECVSLRWLLGQYLSQPNIFTRFHLRHPLWKGTIERKKFNKNISIKRAQTGMWSERGWIKHFQICTSPPTFKWVAFSGYLGEKMREWRKKSSTSAAMWPLT